MSKYFYHFKISFEKKGSVSKGWGAIAKLKKKQELLVRFGYYLGELFRDSP